MADRLLVGNPTSIEINYTDGGTLVKISAEETTDTLWDIWAEYFKQISSIRIGFSGGIDCQFALQVAKKLGITVNPITYAAIWEDNVVNSADVVASQRFCEKNGLRLEVIDLDLYEFLNSNELVHFATTYKTVSPQIATHLKFMSMIGNSDPLLLGGDIPGIVARTSEYKCSFLSGAKSQITNLIAPYYAYANTNNLNLTKDLFFINAKALYQGMRHNFQVLEDTGLYVGGEAKIQFVTSTLNYKTAYYKSFGVPITPTILKHTGFENLKKYFACQTGVFNEFDNQYRFPLDSLMNNNSWYKNFNRLTVQDEFLERHPMLNEYREKLLATPNAKDATIYSFDF